MAALLLAAGPQVTVPALLEELVDFRAPCEFPSHPYQARLASSREPASVAPGADGGLAGADRRHFAGVFENEGRREDVLLDCTGPGALVRLWCAEPAGVLRVYVDGGEQPVLAGPLAELMEAVPPPLSERRGGTATLLLPIPFERGCRVTSTGAGELAYQIAYRAWSPGTPVVSFTAGDLERYAPQLAAAAQALGRGPSAVEGEITHPFGHRIASTGQDGAAIYAGLSHDAAGQPGAVSELRLLVRDADPADGAGLARLLREALLVLSFDGVETVKVPLGDFFGSPALEPFESRFLAVQADGEQAGLLSARFPMPFEEALFVRVESLCPEPLDVQGFVTIVPYEWTPRTLHFHAAWRGERGVAARAAGDWSVARLEGRGLLVGDALSLTHPGEAAWRGGDERLYVDGEPFPSLFGTGPADDFARGADSGGPFATPLFGRTASGGPGHAGVWSEYRLRTLDAVPFFARLDIERELPHAGADSDPRVDLAATVWYYAGLDEAPGGEDASGTLPPGK